MSDSTYDLEQVIGGMASLSNRYRPAVGGTTTSIQANSSPIIALPFNFSRKSFMIWNSDAQIYVKLGSNISPLSFSFLLNAGKIFAMDSYGGPVMIQAVNDSSTVLITELS